VGQEVEAARLGAVEQAREQAQRGRAHALEAADRGEDGEQRLGPEGRDIRGTGLCGHTCLRWLHAPNISRNPDPSVAAAFGWTK
jgi:hypothetical protein